MGIPEVPRETGSRPLATYFQGEQTELPSTVDDIRAALPEDRRAEFETALAEFIGYWALEARPDLRDADRATFARLERGDFSGFTPAEEWDG
ncbi:hypothetical protein JNUCC64_12175 [Streptomyces sp. JNUCC 64]